MYSRSYKKRHFKKNEITPLFSTQSLESTPRERTLLDLDASDVFGIGASRINLRTLASLGKTEQTQILFEPCQSLDNIGVLLVVPFLLQNGLLSYKGFYHPFKNVYYDLDFIILLLSFMFLCRIKNVSQLKGINSGEFGKLLGVDRIPEARCLYKKISDITTQEKAMEWNKSLAKRWIEKDETMIYYIDGHIQVYHGDKAVLGKKHVSRQRLCLPGVMQYWVNNAEGMPYLYVTGEVNEKLQEMLETKIVPLLKEELAQKVDQATLEADEDLPRFTIVFDREGYSPVFFKKLWNTCRVAVITYRKNVTDLWDENDFETKKIEIDGDFVEMDLCEKSVTLNGVSMREIRKKRESGHQTSVVTTNKKLSMILIAIYMFARWSQENFFRYMRQEYDLDRLYQAIVINVDSEFEVVNPEYSKLNYRIKKIREKIRRREASLYQLTVENVEEPMEKTGANLIKQAKNKEELDIFRDEETNLVEERKQHSYKIKIKDIPEEFRYTKIAGECKHVMSIIKMICYRSETSFVNLIPNSYKKKETERRAFAKNSMQLKGDIIPDYENNILTVIIYTMSTPRENEALKEIIQILNDSETKFPGTNLTLVYKFATKEIVPGLDL